jgi:hypothetical protein
MSMVLAADLAGLAGFLLNGIAEYGFQGSWLHTLEWLLQPERHETHSSPWLRQ